MLGLIRTGTPRRRRGLTAALLGAACGLLLVLAAPALASGASGDTYTWTGGGYNGDWSIPYNWTCSGPGCTATSSPISDPHSDVVLPAGVSNLAPYVDYSADVNSLTIGSPSYSISGSNALTVDSTASLQGVLDPGGSMTYNGAVTLTGPTTLSGNGIVTFNSTVDGDSTLQLTAPVAFNSAVGASTPLASLDDLSATMLGANVDTAGTQTYAQEVVLTGSATLTGSTVNFEANVQDSTSGADGLTISGDAVFQSDVGPTALASLYVSGTTELESSGIVWTTGQQTYGGAVGLQVNSYLSASQVTFAGAVDSQGGSSSLTIAGDATFAGVVGGSGALSGLGVTGTTHIDGSAINTSGEQIYYGGVTLGADTALSANGSGSSISFKSTVDGAHDLTVTADQNVTFWGAVGATTPLANLSVIGTNSSAGGILLIGSVSTTGAQTYTPGSNTSGAGGVSIVESGSQPVTLNAAEVTFNGEVSGGSLIVRGSATLGEGGGLSSFTVTGSLTLSGGTFTAPGTSTYTLSVGGDFNATGATYDGFGTLTLDGSGDQHVTTGGNIIPNLSVTGGGTVSLEDPLDVAATVDVSAPSTLDLNGQDASVTALVGDGAVSDSAGPSTLNISPGRSPDTFAGAISGPVALTKVGQGSLLTLSGAGTSTGTTDVQGGTLDVTGSLAGPLTVETGAIAFVTGTVNGTVTINSGWLGCYGGALNGGPVTNNSGTLSGLPGQPSGVSAQAGVRQAQVSFTPASGTPCQPVSYTATASPGGSSGSGSGSPITVGGLSDATSYSFTVTATNPLGSTTSEPSSQITTIGPPTISISAPVNWPRYMQGQSVRSTFSCADRAGGPGISSCRDQGGLVSGALIDTATLGAHTFTVTAESKDGLTTTRTVHYRVLPSNRITVLHAWLSRRGVLALRLLVPNEGKLRVIESASVTSQLEASTIFAVSSEHLVATHKGVLSVTLSPDWRARRVLADYGELRHVQLVISYTPVGGIMRTAKIRVPS